VPGLRPFLQSSRTRSLEQLGAFGMPKPPQPAPTMPIPAQVPQGRNAHLAPARVLTLRKPRSLNLGHPGARPRGTAPP
jgi:hypothetical protein